MKFFLGAGKYNAPRKRKIYLTGINSVQRRSKELRRSGGGESGGELHDRPGANRGSNEPRNGLVCLHLHGVGSVGGSLVGDQSRRRSI